MAGNLVSYILQFLTPDMIGRVAGALGLDANKVQGAIAAAVPTLLAGLGGVAAQPGGAEKIADAVGQQSATLSDLTNMLSAGNQAPLIQNGSKILSSLFGTGDSGMLANAISNHAGLDKNAGTSLLGMLAPLVLNGLADKSDGDLSPGNIAGLLASQKDNIAAALPSGIGEMLAGTGLLGALGGTVRTASQTAARTTAAASSAASTAQQSVAQAAPSSSRWLLWLIALLIVAAALYYYLGRPRQQAATPPATTTTQEVAPAAMDVGKQLGDTLTSLQTAVGGITDAASAQAALPKLQAAQADIDKIATGFGQLSAAQKTALAAVVKPMVPTLNGLFDKVLAIPGVSEVLKPTIDAIRAKLATLAA
ncbi:DUF937 domain-containing protein [Rhizobium sp. KVB221]|uniref:DUF937 domain-containing protein n=1 Tax=Rhizobium setariae TaxID=2801340 RepID=A0A936YJI9_9HYPH|nr:DUF937 domain-containing protein [Rhizobium setariae]MBL0371440.1 DUF937 domain-containing protein [Rhizobium setariae]